MVNSDEIDSEELRVKHGPSMYVGNLWLAICCAVTRCSAATD